MSPVDLQCAVTGIGQSAIGRPLNRDPLALTAEACLAAIADAGLRREDIDGLATYPGAMLGGAAPGFSGALSRDSEQLPMFPPGLAASVAYLAGGRSHEVADAAS